MCGKKSHQTYVFGIRFYLTLCTYELIQYPHFKRISIKNVRYKRKNYSEDVTWTSDSSKKTQNSEKEISAWMLEIDPGLVSALILNF